MKKLVVLFTAFALAAGVGFIGGGPAAAAPLQQWRTTGDTFETFGDHSFCRGAVTLRIDAPPKKRGVVRVTATSRGFTGNGPTWNRTPRCRILFLTAYTSVRGLSLEKWTTGSFGRKAGEKRVWEVSTGIGIASIYVSTYSANSPVRLHQGLGAGGYYLVP